MSKSDKKIIILTKDELRKTFSRLTFEIIEKISNLENLLLVGIPTRGVHLAEVLRKEMLDKIKNPISSRRSKNTAILEAFAG